MILGVWAILVMKLAHLSILPNVTSKTKLTHSGPYKVIRHPMYTALIILSVAIYISNPVWDVLIVGVILMVNLILKLNYEEKS